MKLDGRAAIVVGAGAQTEGIGNGRAVAIAYARAGAAVVCVDRMLERAEATVEHIRTAGGRAMAVQADATAGADVERAVAKTLETCGRLDIMHNNVGAGGGAGGDPTTISEQ